LVHSATTGNNDSLQTTLIRSYSGSDWYSATWKLGRKIDSTDVGYIAFGPSFDPYGLEFGTYSGMLMRLSSYGRVGIGKTPTVALDVLGAITASSGITGTTGTFSSQVNGSLFVEKYTTFTPTTVGWYRVFTTNVTGGGVLRIYASYNNKKDALELVWNSNGWGQTGQISIVKGGMYVGYIVSQVRVTGNSGDGAGYLDIYVSDVTSVVPISLYAYGPDCPAFTAPIVVGAVVGTGTTKTLSVERGIGTTDQFYSSVATGTAPLVVASTTLVSNLNVQYLNGQLGSFYQDAGNLNAGTLLAARMPALTGDITTSAGAVATTLASVGTASTYRSVTTDAKGRVIAGTNPTTLAGYGLTDAMKVGGIPGVDLNTLTTSGVYRIQNTEANRPSSLQWGQLLVIQGGADTITQIYGDYTAGTLYTRSGNPSNVGGVGSYSPWRTLLGDHNYSSYALPLTGGSVTGTTNIDGTTFYVDAVNHRVGINKNNPAYLLDVAGRISYNGAIGEGADTTLSSFGTTLMHGASATWAAQAFYIAGANAMSLNSTGLTVNGLLKAGSGVTTLTDASGKILSAALNTVAVSQGGTGATVLTGYVIGSGTGAFTASTSIPTTNLSGLGTGVTALLAGTSSGTGGPAGTASPTFTGTVSAAAIVATSSISPVRAVGSDGTNGSLTPISNILFLGANVYYNGSAWVHASAAANANNQLLALSPGAGVSWYASNNSSPSWNVANGVYLWDVAGNWVAPVYVGSSQSKAAIFSAGGILTYSSVTSTELGYLSGVTSAIQTQLNGKQATITTLPVSQGGTGATTLTGYVTGNGTGAFTASTSIPATNITGTMTVSTGGTGANTLSGYLFGNGTSAVTASATIPASVLSGTVATTQGGTGLGTYTLGDILYASVGNVLAKRAIGSAGQVLTVSGGVPTWAAPSVSGFATSIQFYVTGQNPATNNISLQPPSSVGGPRTQVLPDKSGDVQVDDAVNGLSISALKVDSNGIKINRIRHGFAQLAAGTVTVSDGYVYATTRIMLTAQEGGTTPGFLRVSARVSGTSFTITSSNATDTAKVAWVMIEP